MLSKSKTIFVGLSGGVDSSVVALRLLRQGYSVVGVFIKTWQPEFLTCTWENERLEAMRVSAHLGIPFLTCDATDAYKTNVADYMVREYTEGRTPNPDVMCNQFVKFGAFLDFAKSHGAETVATGHYAQVNFHEGRYRLYRGVDESKDQSYFLWALSQEQLSHIYFPVGDTKKSAVRMEARTAHLPTCNKQDSQGICFLGDIDMKEFLSYYIPPKTGDILGTDGSCIGTHEGAHFYTIGQRHGFTITTTKEASLPYYVVAKDLKKNTIVVSHTPIKIQNIKIHLTHVNSIQKKLPSQCQAQFRYRQKPFNIVWEGTSDDHGMLTVSDTDIDVPSLGQSCVFYNTDECLGGGIINDITELD